MMLTMSVWDITHPDTLGYHAQTILWSEKYKAIPGLAHLHVRYGYQSLWFTLCAFFNLNFLGTNQITFLNTAVLLWFLIFVIQKAAESLKKNNISNTLLWLLLLSTSLWSYTQVRLTATSASPDFIATLYCWLIVYLIITYKKPVYLQLAFLLSFVALTIKLSAAPVLLFALYALLKQIYLKKWRPALWLTATAAGIFLPFIARNIISSGYIIFPLPAIDIVSTDWKYNKERTSDEKNFIKAYARISTTREKAEVDAINKMHLTEWIPKWWKGKSSADKLILSLSALLCLIFVFSIKWINRQMDRDDKYALAFTALGLIFWLFNAPDPRFGFGFIIPFCAIILLQLSAHFSVHSNLKLAFALGGFIILLVGGYTTYRLVYYFQLQQIVKPAGIQPVAYKRIPCNGSVLHVPENDLNCGNTPLPCTDSCGDFLFRGNRITDGFTSVK
jgi:hypothetical protein